MNRHPVHIAISAGKAKGPPTCEKCRNLVTTNHLRVVRATCGEGHRMGDAQNCADFRDASVQRPLLSGGVR